MVATTNYQHCLRPICLTNTLKCSYSICKLEQPLITGPVRFLCQVMGHSVGPATSISLQSTHNYGVHAHESQDPTCSGKIPMSSYYIITEVSSMRENLSIKKLYQIHFLNSSALRLYLLEFPPFPLQRGGVLAGLCCLPFSLYCLFLPSGRHQMPTMEVRSYSPSSHVILVTTVKNNGEGHAVYWDCFVRLSSSEVLRIYR